jgi:hypothetical protein
MIARKGPAWAAHIRFASMHSLMQFLEKETAAEILLCRFVRLIFHYPLSSDNFIDESVVDCQVELLNDQR